MRDEERVRVVKDVRSEEKEEVEALIVRDRVRDICCGEWNERCRL